ncbi:MAG: DM13 domain-containing protein [Anaerolineales bacterium]|nr:DM13 domain-containing protein [Anaerolineales bacterium]
MVFTSGCGTSPATPTASQVSVADTPSPLPTSNFTPTQPPLEIPTSEPEATEIQPTESAAVILLQGKFEGADQDHTGAGTATIYQRADGTYYLNLENFSVCCGPDLYVFFVRKPSSAEYAELGEFLEISSLAAISGDQDYEIPENTDLSQFKSVAVYCKPFQVIIAFATMN